MGRFSSLLLLSLSLSGCAHLGALAKDGARAYLDTVDTGRIIACAVLEDGHAQCLGMLPTAEKTAEACVGLSPREWPAMSDAELEEAARVIRRARLLGADL